MKLYEKIFNRRIENLEDPSKLFEIPVLEKLLEITFNNDSSPGELPNEFIISDIIFPKADFQKLLESFDLEILRMEHFIGNFGSSFKVFLK